MNAATSHPLVRYGCHRVVEPAGVLPQAAARLEPGGSLAEGEIRCTVDALNIDSASFRQIADACGNDASRIAGHIRSIVRKRGKMHNPVTGSGGMFIGRVRELGPQPSGAFAVGDRIASLVSLTLTPLELDAIDRIDLATGRLWVRGSAILFASGIAAKLPDDIDEAVALAVLDVAGAPAQVERLVRPGDTVAVFGADGKSGILACVAARIHTKAGGRVIGFAPDATSPGARLLVEHGFVDRFVALDARDTATAFTRLLDVLPEGADLVVNCVNVPGTELASIAAARDEGTVYFFSMCTSFTAAALGAEGIGKDVTMLIGNGFTKGHARAALDTLRAHAPIRAHFERTYGS